MVPTAHPQSHRSQGARQAACGQPIPL